MIRKAQIKFISIVMTILFIVFLVIFCAVSILIKNSNDRNIGRILRDTKESFFMTEEHVVSPNGLIVVLATDRSILQSFCDETVFTQREIIDITKQVTSRPYNNGKVGNIYYFLEPYQQGELLIALDLSDIVSAHKLAILNTFTILITIYLFLFFVVWSLSFKVFRPIREAFFRQKQFISNASHELKTPLAIISANADVLNQNQNNKWVKSIKSQTNRMDVLVADMLSLAQFDEGKIKLNKQEFNISQLVTGVALPFDAVAFEKGKTLTLDIEENLNFFGDIQSVKKIVDILIDNAIKHAEPNSEIILTLKKESNKITLSVYNKGSLIPYEHSNKIFERFYRGDVSRSRDSGGSGLGLSIAKSITDANKWKISAVSHYNDSMKITVIM